MKLRLLALGILLSVGVLAVPVAAQAQYPEAPSQGYVSDTLGVLSAQQKQELTKIGAELEKKTGVRLVSAAVAGTQGESIITYGLHLYKKWELGLKNNDTSALLVISAVDKQSDFEVGAGLDKLLNKADTDAIRSKAVAPALSGGDYAGGLVAGYKAAAAQLYKAKHLAPPDSLKESGPDDGTKLIFGACIVLLLLAVTGGRFRAGKSGNEYKRPIFRNPFGRRQS